MDDHGLHSGTDEEARFGVSPQAAISRQSPEAQREGFQNWVRVLARAEVGSLGASLDGLLLRLSRVLGGAALAHGRATAQRARQGRRAPGSAASARSAPQAAAAAEATRCRSRVPRSACTDSSASTSSRADRDAADAFALASRACAQEVGAATTEAGPATPRASPPPAGLASRAGESPLGLRADRWRAAQARRTRFAKHGPAT